MTSHTRRVPGPADRPRHGTPKAAWTLDGAGVALAKAGRGANRLHLLAEPAFAGWFWLAWTPGSTNSCVQGEAGTLDDAKAAAERAASELAAKPKRHATRG